MFNIINLRQKRYKATLISTNLLPEDILNRYDDRIHSRLSNKLIALNDERFDKKLWSNKDGESSVNYTKYYDEQEEANTIASKIYNLVERQGYNYSDIAILVRMNALTLPFEEK